MREKIYVVEDEQDIRQLISLTLQKAGFVVKDFENGSDFLKYIERIQLPDLVLLDLMLPDQDGFSICQQLRTNPRTKKLPVIMLTARSKEVDKVYGLNVGADDYLTKPFSTPELIARINALLRRSLVKTDLPLQIQIAKDLSLDAATYELKVAGKLIEVTAAEFKILHLLAANPGLVFSREKILDYLWGSDKAVMPRTVDVHIKNLREKIGKYGDLIVNVRGIGYKLQK